MKIAQLLSTVVLLTMAAPISILAQPVEDAVKQPLPVADLKPSASVPTPPPDLSLSLDAAIDVALENNPSLLEARSRLEAADADLDLSRSPYRPLVNFDTDASARFVGIHEIGGNVVLDATRSAQEGRLIYDRLGTNDFRREDHEEFNVTQRLTRTFHNGTQFQLETSESMLQDSLSYYDDDPYRSHDLQSAARVNYTIPFNSRERLRIRTNLNNADLSYEQSLNSLTQQQEDVIYRVNVAYWNLKYSEEDLAIQRDYLDQSRRTYESFQIRNEYGFVSDFDVKQSRVAMRRIEASLLAQETQVRDQYESLNLLLGLPIDHRIELTDPLKVSEQVRSDEEYIDLVLSTNLLLKNIRLGIDQSENNLTVTKLGQQPSVALVNSYQRDDGGDSYANFLFQVSWPFGDGGATKARVRASENRIEEQRIRLWDEERSLRQQVIQILRQIETAREQLTINEENAILSKEALDIANFRFENGQIEFRDLQDAQIDLANSRVSQANTIRSLNVSFAALESLIHGN
ncbi:MAG: TolC family protein [bacterium]